MAYFLAFNKSFSALRIAHLCNRPKNKKRPTYPMLSPHLWQQWLGNLSIIFHIFRIHLSQNHYLRIVTTSYMICHSNIITLLASMDIFFWIFKPRVWFNNIHRTFYPLATSTATFFPWDKHCWILVLNSGMNANRGQYSEMIKFAIIWIHKITLIGLFRKSFLHFS